MALPILTAMLPVVTSLMDKILPDKTAAQKAKNQLALLAAEGALDNAAKQIQVNMEEAKHKSLWVAGWRPAVGWVCATAFAYHFIIYPMLVFVLAIFGMDVTDLPKFEVAQLMTVLGGLLGLGSLRTYEKLKGVTDK